MAYLSRISVFPIKSLAPCLPDSARIVEPGALEHDRELALFDATGKWINAKRTAQIHRLQASFDTDARSVSIRADGEPAREFRTDSDRQQLAQWLSDFFRQPVHIEQQRRGGFPDDTDLPGPTVISTATLEEVARWFPGVTVDDARLRFRANLEIADVPAFWEDRLYAEAGRDVAFAIGDVTLLGANPCQRCVVPSRDPHSGTVWEGFQKTFAERRAATLPAWAERERFNHFYRLAVNTRIEEASWGKVLAVGDEVRLLA